MKAKDLWGALALPMDAPDLTVPGRTRAIGDPGLATVASFMATVLIAELGDASAALWPGYPTLEAEGDLGAGTVPVRRIFLFQPRPDRPFVQTDLPALFVFRYAAEKNKFEWLASDVARTNIPIMVWWVAGRTEPETEKYRDPFLNAVGKALMGAVNFGYHRAWVVEGDREKAGSLVPAAATSTSTFTLSGAGLTGALVGEEMRPARPIQVQTLVSPGAYIPGTQVQVAGIDGRGLPWNDAVTLTSANGGEKLLTTFRFRTTTSITFQGQASTAGQFVVGYGPSPEASTGSRFMRIAGISEVMHRHAGETKTVAFKVGEPVKTENQTKPPEMVTYRALELVFDCYEDSDPNPALHGASATGMDGSYLLPNGELFASHDTF